MRRLPQPRFTERHKLVTEKKAGGVTYTPKLLADFVARQIVETTRRFSTNIPVRILDPAVGDGELLISLLEQLAHKTNLAIRVYGFETSLKALNLARVRLKQQFRNVTLHLELGNFLEFVLERFGEGGSRSSFHARNPASL